MSVVIRTENLSKMYRLGLTDRGLLYAELQSAWARFWGKADPNATVVDARKTKTQDSHGTIWAVKDVNIEIKDGDVVGIIGRNGSGKSTLLKILSRITSPTKGHAFIKGRVASLLEVGTGFHPELTGRENVHLNGSILGLKPSDIKRRFDEIVAFSEVEEFIDTPVKRYSSGMKVRLAFSVAAHLDPQILIVDEVLAVGDAAFQQKCLGRMNETARDGRTVLFVSHNAAAVENLCKRGIVMQDGEVVFQGNQDEALEFYSQQNSTGEQSLNDRRDRKGTGQVIISAIEFRDKEGRRVTSVRCGDPVDVVLHYRNLSGGKFPEANLRVTFLNHLDVPVFTHHNSLSGHRLDFSKSEGAVICHLPAMPVHPGIYHLNYSLKTSFPQGDYLDYLYNAATLRIDTGDYYGTGQMAEQSQGSFLMKGSWRTGNGVAPQEGVQP